MTDIQELNPIPITKTEPWKHQIEAYHETKMLSSVLFYMGMGTGKSRCVIDQIANDHKMKKILIVCPLAVISAWELQFETHFPGKYIFLKLNSGSTVANHRNIMNGLKLQETRRDPVIGCVNYESIWRGVFGTFLIKNDWDMIVADECFTAGTMVATPRGRVPIEKIKIGDQVYGYDFALGKTILTVVKDTFCRRTTQPLLEWMGNYITAGHPVWTVENGFMEAVEALIKKNKTGIRLYTSFVAKKFDLTKTGSCTLIDAKQGAVVYNIETEVNNYFANGILVHNCQKIKAPGSKVSRFMGRLGKRAKRRIGLSGTPLANSPMDAYAEFRFLNPNIFGTSFVRFRSKFAVMGGYGGYQVIGYRNKEEFTKRFHSITFHVDSSVLDLPEAKHVEIPIIIKGDNTKYTLQVYKSLEREFVAGVRGGVVTVSNALVKLLRLQQITSGFIFPDGPDAKIERLNTLKEDALIELMSAMGDEPVVVFCRFREDLDSVHRAAEKLKLKSLELSGKYKELERWQAGEGQVIAVQISSGAEGISLVRAKYAVYYSLGFSLSQYEQSLARLNRPGQERPVTYYHLIIKGTVDEKLYKALSQKKKVIDELLVIYNRYSEAQQVADQEYIEKTKQGIEESRKMAELREARRAERIRLEEEELAAMERRAIERKRKEIPQDEGRAYQDLFEF